jgi:alpha-tubulin suppressor-like RCC1 family protein
MSTLVHYRRPTPTKIASVLFALALAVGLLTSAMAGTSATADSPKPAAADAPVTANISVEDVTDRATVSEMDASGMNSCVVTEAGTVWCWGANGHGQLGNGTTGSGSDEPVRVRGGEQGGTYLTDVVTLGHGGDFACAATTDGSVYCWGDNGYGELGNGTRKQSNTPVRVHAGDQGSGNFARAKSVSAGKHYACAVTTDKSAFCWGIDNQGQLGSSGTSKDGRTRPVQVVAGEQGSGKLSNVHDVVAHIAATCAITDYTDETGGKVYCWGNDFSGAVGIGRGSGAVPQPNKVCLPGAGTQGNCGNKGQLSGAVMISDQAAGDRGTADDKHSDDSVCVVTVDKAAYCWGLNVYGELGIGTASGPHTCGTGNNTVPCAQTPRRVKAGEQGGNFLSGVTDISSGFTSCAIADEKIYCWGYNEYGTVDNTRAENVSSPRLKATDPAVDVSVAAVSVCYETTDGRAFCWGGGVYGQLGNGEAPPRRVQPQRVGMAHFNPYLVEFGEVGVGVTAYEYSDLKDTFFGGVGVMKLDRTGSPDYDAAPATVGSSENVCGVVPGTVPRVVLLADLLCKVQVTFTPTQPGKPPGIVWVGPSWYENDQDGNVDPRSAMLAVSGEAPLDPNNPDYADAALADYNDVDFGDVDVGTVKPGKVKIRNIGNAELRIDKTRVITPTDEFDKARGGDNCKGARLAPGGKDKCVVNVRFTPRAEGDAAALLKIYSNSISNEYDAAVLVGEGIQVIEPPEDLEPGGGSGGGGSGGGGGESGGGGGSDGGTDLESDLITGEAPGKVKNLNARAKSCRTGVATWQPPRNFGTVAPDEYEIRYRKGSSGKWSSWKSQDWVPNANGKLKYTLKKLTPARDYTVQVRAVSAAGNGKKDADSFRTPTCGGKIPTKPGNG